MLLKCDVVEVSVANLTVRVMDRERTIHDAYIIVDTAVERRGVYSYFYAPSVAGTYKTGDKWSGHGVGWEESV